MESNFSFLAEHFPVLARFGQQAELYWQSDANACLMKLGMIGETVVQLIYDIDDIEHPLKDDAVHRINLLEREGYITQDLTAILHALRKKRNLAVHESYESVEDCKVLLPLAYTLTEWFYETYGDYHYEHRDFVPPEVMEARETAEERRKEAAHDEEVAAKAIESASAERLTREKRQKRANLAAAHRYKSEAETRLLIDEQLRRVGWEADTQHLRHSAGTRPQKGRNIAIAEWPTRTGPVDYALFCGEKMVAVVEAKAEYKDVSAVLDGQGKRYATVAEGAAPYTVGKWGDYQVPFIFATNGRPYIEQYKEKSGIWFQDLRDPMNIPHALHGWVSPDGILALLKHDKSEGEKRLAAEPYDELRDPQGLSLRDYQIRAVEAVEQALADGQTSMLLAMATGTGKTRLVLALIYRFLKTRRFRRILFLVDRNVLGSQAEDTFREVKLAELQTLTQIYNVQGIADDAAIERETSVQIATVQSLVRRILYQEGESMPAVTDFDLVIIDEAHRGYILDRDMSEDAALYRDQRDYLSKYRNVVEYFDAVKIALTATPALHTTQIFGAPVFTYSYREAVVDGYLVDHNAPIHIETELSTKGIHYKKGEQVAMIDPETGELLNGAQLEDELDFDIDDFNRKVITENFNREVLKEIARNFDPTEPSQGKMMIFAANDQHADLIVRLLRELYEGMAPADAIRKITGTIENGNQKKIREAVQHFKNEVYPSIVVTVDLLTTGIDVPAITTLVFLRRVKSRILFEQMLGRATRLCPAIHKAAFDIYDPVGTYAALEKVSDMKPVVTNPKETFAKLLDGLEEASLAADSALRQKRLSARLGRFTGRLRRKSKLLDTSQDKEAAASLAIEGKAPASLTAFINAVKDMQPEQARTVLLANRAAIEALESIHRTRKGIVIDGHTDKVTRVYHGYGEGETRPEDYLESFTTWVRENRDKIEALQIVCTRPQDLTVQDLKSLRKQLSALHFTERQLSDAIAGGDGAAVTADIISLIRRATIGTPLKSHEERIHAAVSRLIDELRHHGKLTKPQENVLRKIEKYFLADENYVIGMQMFRDDSRFRRDGGQPRYDRIFDGHLAEVIDKLNNYLYDDYDDGGKSA
ncbi:type I restriction-modification system endonuclease [uncultured Mitsuokella sp.]|uniref:type I restriction-modification system endonuclease n=1 Tax=uncultured Mitsuokella sp. TaxID=453120 RepID=UPI00266C51E7|nr:type I restriction-modification system endonuclease [uncultured Mitsuokella sp.]